MLKRYLRSLNSLDVFSGIGILLFLFAYPFFMWNRYFKITFAKTMFFFFVSFFFAVGCLILRRRLRKRELARVPLVRKNRTELYFILFLVLAAVSCAQADSPGEALSGGNGRNMGLLMFLFIWLAYIFVSRFGQFKTPVAVVFGVSLVLMNLISFLQFCRLDPFGLYVGTSASVKTGFMSMLGNKDVYYSYLSLAVPFALLLTFEAETLREKIFWYAVGFVGFVGIVICNCEGGYICLLVSFLYLFFAKCRDRQNLLVFLRIAMLFFAAGLLVACLKFNFKNAGIREDAMTRLFITVPVCGAGLAVFTALYALVLKKEPPEKLFPVLRRAAAIACAVAAAGVAGAFIYFSFINTTASIGKLGVFLRYGGRQWGSGRSLIWRDMAFIYRELPFFRKLVGAGEETVGFLMHQYLPDRVAESDKLVDNAHNEYLQYLVTHGLLGLTAYLLFAVSAVRRGFREGGRYQRAAALGACCYLAQAFFNITQALTTPLFFVFLALAQTREIDLPPKYPADLPEPAEAAQEASENGEAASAEETSPAAVSAGA